jgi:nucleotide-binding universal stress UspA family protein
MVRYRRTKWSNISGAMARPLTLFVSNIFRHGRSPMLQAKAHDIGADILVAGAFGHPRLWEKLLGGVTRDLLDGMKFPIFTSY